MDNIIDFDGYTMNDINAEKMLNNIADGEPKNAFVITWDDENVSFHSSTVDMPMVIYNIQEFMHRYYNGTLGEE